MSEVKLDDKGLVPAIAQDINTGQVLMLGYMNPGSVKRTVEGTQVWFYSRSQEDLWHKGEVSGNYLNLREWYVDCDSDTILLKVEPDGPACHTGEVSCFYTRMDDLPDEYTSTEGGPRVLDELFAVIKDRQREMPEGSYTAKLLAEGTSRVWPEGDRGGRRGRPGGSHGRNGKPAGRDRRPVVPHADADGVRRRVAERGMGRVAVPTRLGNRAVDRQVGHLSPSGIPTPLSGAIDGDVTGAEGGGTVGIQEHSGTAIDAQDGEPKRRRTSKLIGDSVRVAPFVMRQHHDVWNHVQCRGHGRARRRTAHHRSEHHGSGAGAGPDRAGIARFGDGREQG